MDIKTGRRIPFAIEYVQITEENINEVAEWCGGVVGGGKDDEALFVRIVDKNAINTRQTKGFVNDIIVHHLELNTFKSFGVKSFNKSYEATEVVEHSRSSETGRYVSEEEAQAHPETTVTEQTELPRDAGLA